MIYITGDKHGNFNEIKKFCKENNTTKDDVLNIVQYKDYLVLLILIR